MNALPCFVLFAAAISGTVAMELLDSSMMESLVSKMINLKLFDPKTKSKSYRPCSDLEDTGSFIKCYTNMHTQYTGNHQGHILAMFLQRANELTTYYNSIVFSFTTEIMNDKNKDLVNLLKTAISNISFEDSQLYCVASFIQMFNDKDLPVNNLIADYVFYHHFSGHLTENATRNTFHQHINEYFMYQNHVTITTKIGFLAELGKAKASINKYSKPFCELRNDLNLMWKDGDAWLWTALKRSVLLPDIVMDGQDIYNYRGLLGDVTLNMVLKNITDYNRARTTIDHYELVKSILNKYVMKVLIRKVIYVVTNAMQLYYEDVSGLNQNYPVDKKRFEDYRFTQFYLLQLVRSFKISLGFYLTSSFWLNTIYKNEPKFMASTINELEDKLTKQTGSKNPKEPQPAIEEINKLLDISDYWTLIPDSGKVNPIEHYSKLEKFQPHMKNLIIEMERINVAIAHLVEVIKPL